MKTENGWPVRLLNILLLLGSSVLALLIVEISLSIGHRRHSGTVQEMPGEPVQSTVLFQYDPIAGWDGIPSIQRQVRGVTFTHNSMGLRGPEISAEKGVGTTRVLVLGDSQAYGNELPDDQTISSHVSAGGGSLEGINLGISGYGIDQSLLRFVARGLPLKPDYAAFVLFPENDLAEITSANNWGAEKPVFRPEAARLCLYNSPPARVAGWPNNSIVHPRNQLLGFIQALLPNLSSFATSREWRPAILAWLQGWPSMHLQGLYASVKKHILCIRPGRPSVTSSPTQVDLALEIFQLFKMIADDYEVKLLVLIKPAQADYTRHEHVNPPPLISLISGLRQKGIEVIDLAPRLREKNLSESQLFISGYHLSGRGNQEIAEAIREWIEKHRRSLDG
jgi:lysophospholipase L1-like esterase